MREGERKRQGLETETWGRGRRAGQGKRNTLENVGGWGQPRALLEGWASGENNCHGLCSRVGCALLCQCSLQHLCHWMGTLSLLDQALPEASSSAPQTPVPTEWASRVSANMDKSLPALSAVSAAQTSGFNSTPFMRWVLSVSLFLHVGKLRLRQVERLVQVQVAV